MEMTPFHAYCHARTLENLSEEEKLLPVYASSDIQVYPYQIAAAGFALRSPWRKGAILCDEAGMGKSHEATLIMAQRYLEGCNRILLCIPNADLLSQWTDLLERRYTIPYAVAAPGREDAFSESGVVICTYDFAASHEAEASALSWDMAVFDEATALSGVYREENRQARALRRIAGNAFKLLISGTPIEKNIFDLYGLLYFIDETILPDEREFSARYFRRPEHYPELAERVSPYCFRTLRAQASAYAKIPDRLLLTVEYAPSPEERKLYELLFAYVNKPEKRAFPEMDSYDLALRLLGLQSSSTAAIRQTLSGIVRRLETMPDAETETAELRGVLAACDAVTLDTKARLLLDALERAFILMKRRGISRKAVIFTESVETQKMLEAVLSPKYKTVSYNGSSGYAAVAAFQKDAEILISTDRGARGFNLEVAALVIHYDLLYNTLKMEQRIDRCHRMGQENDVLSIAFINKENFSDVRKLELMSKRTLVSDGVFGVSEEVLGGFTDNMEAGFKRIAERQRTRAQIEADYKDTLTRHEEENRRLLSVAEDTLFSAFTKELAEKVRLTPEYVARRSEEVNATLWELAKVFFRRYNAENDDCRFVIDETAKTVTATDYEELPVLFYYWNGKQNVKYRSQKRYGMAADFKPRYGRVTLTSILGRGILHELPCAESGVITVERGVETACILGLYHVILYEGRSRVSEKSVLVGMTESGAALTREQCRELLTLPVVSFTEEGRSNPQWLKSEGKPHPLDNAVPVQELIDEQNRLLSPALTEETERLKLETARKKAALDKAADELENRIRALTAERDAVSHDRFRRLALDKRINALRRECMAKRESRFFDAMRLDLELEERLEALTGRGKLTAKVTREFIVTIRK